MPSQSLAKWISLGVGAASALRIALVWDRLRARMASHFGPSGQPDGFMPRDGFFIFYFGVFGLVITLFMIMPAVLGRIPRELVNIPHRDYWLTDERWPDAMDRMSSWMAWFGVGLTVMAAGVLHLVLRSNLQRMPLDNGVMLGLIGCFFAFTFSWLFALYRAFRPPTE